MGRARRTSIEETDALHVREAQRLGTPPEMIDYLAVLREKQSPLKPKEERAARRARILIRGRGWPTEKIEIFFLEDDQLEEIGDGAPWLPSVLGPTAVSVPRSFCKDLSEAELTRIILHEMVHARSRGLPGRNLPDSWWEDIGLYQFSEGLTESIAERIMPLPERPENALLRETRKAVEEICREAGLDKDAIERMSAEEATLVVAENLGQTLEELSFWLRENTGIRA